MSDPCIHGFSTEQCVSCRTCPHGQLVTSCVRCRAALKVRTGAGPAAELPSEQHGGYEIFFEPAVSGWRYRGKDEAASQLSYRSAFLARKAVDGLGGAPAAVATATAKKPKRKR